jgi:hypothetical protein
MSSELLDEVELPSPSSSPLPPPRGMEVHHVDEGDENAFVTKVRRSGRAKLALGQSLDEADATASVVKWDRSWSWQRKSCNRN